MKVNFGTEKELPKKSATFKCDNCKRGLYHGYHWLHIIVFTLISSLLAIMAFKLTETKDKVFTPRVSISEFELLEVFMDDGSTLYFLGESYDIHEETFWYSRPIKKKHRCFEKDLKKYLKDMEN